MANKIVPEIKNPIFNIIPAEFMEAKNLLRDRLFSLTVGVEAEALKARKKKVYQPTPALNLVGVGIGEKISDGKQTGELCVKVFVAKKFPKGKVKSDHRIPEEIDGLPTDIEEVGYPTKFVHEWREQWRPIIGGVSVGPDSNAINYQMAGTFGVLVEDKTDQNKKMILSNNHVLADENKIPIGAGIVQPGTLDGETNSARVASLTRFVPLKFDNRRNWIDGAVASVDNGIMADATILGIGTPKGSGRPSLNLVVRKSGRTTGLTEGIVRAINFDVTGIRYDSGMVRVDDVIVIKGLNGSFSNSGDSGSAIIDPNGRVVALLFAGSQIVTYAIPIRRVLRSLKIRIATK